MDEYLHDLSTIVNIDSGTYTKAGAEAVGAYLEQRFKSPGFTTRYDTQTQYGDHLIATHTGQSADGPAILLIESQQASYASATFVCNSDEEIGSPTSRPLIQELARASDAVLVFEPGRAAETIVSSRKGCGQYRVEYASMGLKWTTGDGGSGNAAFTMRTGFAVLRDTYFLTEPLSYHAPFPLGFPARWGRYPRRYALNLLPMIGYPTSA